MNTFINISVSIAALLTALLTYAAMSSPIKPLRWIPAPNPGLKGDFAPNELLAKQQYLAKGAAHGPEDSAIGPDGYIYAGYENGDILRFRRGAASSVFANTGGRPLGLQFDAQGNLIVADSGKGLLSINHHGDIRVLTDSVNGRKMLFVDDLDIARDGTIWFSDASQRWDQDSFLYDLLEMSATGRLLSYSPGTGKTEVHMDGLGFANGVALGPNEEFVLINETAKGRIHRLWLKGAKAGERDLFHQGLPGVPDNISFNGVDTFWVAMPSLREQSLEDMADKPLIRRMVAALPYDSLAPPKIYSFVVGLGVDGSVKYNLQDPESRFEMITSVHERDGELHLGSLTMDAIAVVPLP